MIQECSLEKALRLSCAAGAGVCVIILTCGGKRVCVDRSVPVAHVQTTRLPPPTTCCVVLATRARTVPVESCHRDEKRRLSLRAKHPRHGPGSHPEQRAGGRRPRSPCSAAATAHQTFRTSTTNFPHTNLEPRTCRHPTNRPPRRSPRNLAAATTRTRPSSENFSVAPTGEEGARRCRTLTPVRAGKD